MEISLRNPTGRNTRAHIVTIGNREYFFSYETCIGYRGPCLGEPVKWCCYCEGTDYMAMRIPNSWGPTTGRHFRELGCKEFQVVPREEFNQIIADTLS